MNWIVTVLALATAGCRAPRPVIIDDADASRLIQADATPYRCSVVQRPSEDSAQLAVRCAEEFVRPMGGRIGFTARTEVMGGGNPGYRARMSSFAFDPRAFAICDPDKAGTRAVIFRTSSPVTTGIVVEVPATLTDIRRVRPRESPIVWLFPGVRLPEGCRLLNPTPIDSR